MLVPNYRLDLPDLCTPYRKPTGKVAIGDDYTHSSYDFLLNEGCCDTVKSISGELELIATTPLWESNENGKAAKFTGTDANKFTATASPISTSDGSGTGDFSILMAGYFVREAASSAFVCQRRGTTPFNLANFLTNATTNGSGSVSSETGTVTLMTYASGETSVKITDGLPASGFYIFVGTRVGSTMTLYRNGLSIGSGSGTIRDVSGTNQSFTLGGQGGSTSNPANGRLSLVRLFDYGLNDAEVHKISSRIYDYLRTA